MKFLIMPLMLIAYASFAQADEYIPYEGSAKEFHTNSSFSSKTEGMEFKDKIIYFWKEIKDNYESILTKESWDKSSTQCQSFLNQPLPGVSNNSCLATIALISDANDCLELEFPEKMYRNQSLKSYEKSQMDSMKGFLKMAIGPILTLDRPTFFFSKNNYYQFRQGMWRLYNNELIQKIDALTNNISKVSDDCFPAHEQGKARLSLQNRRNDLLGLRSAIQQSLAEAIVENRKDVANLNAAGYCPKGLSNSYLTRADKTVLSGVAGALAWRIRGNGIWLKEGTAQQREDFAGRVFEMIALFNAPQSPDLAKKMNSAMKHRARKGWGDIYDIGSTDGDPDSDLDAMTERGNYQAGIPDDLIAPSPMDALKNAGFDKTPLHVGALQMGICYLVAQYGIPFSEEYYFGKEWKAPLVVFIKPPLSYGELCAGAALGLGLGYSLGQGPRCEVKKNTLSLAAKAIPKTGKKIWTTASDFIIKITKKKQKSSNPKQIAAERAAAQKKAAKKSVVPKKKPAKKAAKTKKKAEIKPAKTKKKAAKNTAMVKQKAAKNTAMVKQKAAKNTAMVKQKAAKNTAMVKQKAAKNTAKVKQQVAKAKKK
jgi:hypothetical protein